MQRRMMGNRAIFADEGGGRDANMNHHKILNVGARTDPNLIRLRSGHRVRPNRHTRTNMNLAIQPRTFMNKRGFVESDMFTNVSHAVGS